MALVAGLVQGREMALQKAQGRETALEEWALGLDQDLAEAQERAMVQARQLAGEREMVERLETALRRVQEARDSAFEQVQEMASARGLAVEKELVLVQDSLERKVQELELEKAQLKSRVSELEMALDSARAKAMLH